MLFIDNKDSVFCLSVWIDLAGDVRYQWDTQTSMLFVCKS